MADSKFNVDNQIHDLTGANGDNYQIVSELEALTNRINELAADMLKREIHLKDELSAKKEDITSITASLENRNKEIAELQNQVDEIKATNEKNQSLIGGLSSLVADQEMQLQNLRELIGTKEQIITSFAVSLEKSKQEVVELHKQVDELNATNEIQNTLIGEYKEKLDLLNGELSLLTSQQHELQAEDGSELKAEKDTTEENSVLKAEPEANVENSVLKAETNAKEENKMLNTERKAQKKMLKKLLKKNPKANEKILAELLGVESSYIIRLRKEFDI
ncbi:hypothetical protein [Neobacillus sp. DY30]|uniref:coiled-coil domain-containing protein n=1 Tax=Neobacillus sp. DY30 TaxID=3047871 RepID=UPI0024BF7986|nr:hypothetical protein [Neobacillus sp. DY30]WHY00920.1 hypothetical protein QNH29_01055 [Neobacillus sp. DY30]